MSDHQEPHEPALSAERMASLDNTRHPGAHVEEDVVGALRNSGILRAGNVAPGAAVRRPRFNRRTAWTTAIAAVAATLIFIAGVRVGELRSHAQDARSTSGNVASNTPPAHIIWY